MSKKGFRVFQILSLIMCVLVCLGVGVVIWGRVYEQSLADEFELRQEFNRAVTNGDYERAKQMLEKTPKLANLPVARNSLEYAESVNDDTPLIAAGANMKIVRLLVDHGADINKATPISHRYPITSVLASEADERYDVAWFYIGKGADVTCDDYVNGNFLVAALRSEGEININLQNSAVDIVKYGLENGVSTDIPQKLNVGVNSLMGLAAQNNYYKVIQYFYLEKKFDINERVTDDQKTPLMVAVKNGHYGATNYLVFYGAKEGYKDNYGRTAYDYAKLSRDQRIIELLS